MARTPHPTHAQYRVLTPGRIGFTPMIGLAALMISVAPLLRHVESLTPTPRLVVAPALPAPDTHDPELQLIVHIQDAGFFIEGADAVLAPDARRVWCDAERCDEADMRALTERLAAIKAVHPSADHVVFVAGMTVPFGRVQAAMDAARSDSWDAHPEDDPEWLFPRVTVRPGELGEDRYLQLSERVVARI